MKTINYIRQVSISELEKRKKSVFTLIMIHFTTMILSVLLPLLNGNFLDLLISDIAVVELLRYALIIIVIGVISSLFAYIYNVLSIRLKNRIAFEINLNVINHMHKIGLRKFEEYNISYLNQRVNADATTISDFFFDNFLVVAMNVIQFFVLIYILVRIKIIFFLIILLFIPIYIFLYAWLKKPLYSNGSKYKEEQNIFFDKLNEQFELNKEIKIHSDIETQEIDVRKQYEYFVHSLIKLTKISSLFNSLDGIICLVFQAISLLVGGLMVIENWITLGEYSILSLYFTNILGIIKYFFSFGKTYQDFKISVNRMNDLLLIQEECDGKNNINNFNSITVTYNNKKYKFEKGKLNIICGKNGIGKTTLLYILTGILQNPESQVCFEDTPSSVINMYEIRKKNVSFMVQNEKTGNVKVKDYLYRSLEINSKEELEKIIDEKNLRYVFCNARFNLYDYLGKSLGGISDGERQIIILFKTLAKECNALLLDEPSSNLSLSFTAQIIDYLKSIMDKKIVVIVSHENAFIENADYVIEVI